MRCLIRSYAVDSPPWNGCADWALGGIFGGFASPILGPNGFKRQATVSSRLFGVRKGPGWEGMKGGKGGRLDGAGRALRGASRSGSTCFLYVVKTSGRS